MTAAQKRAAAIADNRITAAFYATCAGVQINVLDMPAIFRHARPHALAGASDETLREVVRGFVQTIRKN